MSKAILVQYWQGVCEICNKKIKFSSDITAFSDDKKYICSCGSEYHIDKDMGLYNLIYKGDKNEFKSIRNGY